MTANTFRTLFALAAAAILLGGCSWTQRPTVAPREEAGNSALVADLEALKNENDAMKLQQQASDAKMDELRRLLEENQEEQRAFREMMTTNFDLLEQSVALTLSKGITGSLEKSRTAKAPRKSEPRRTVPAARSRTSAAPAPRTGGKSGDAGPRASASAPQSPLQRSATSPGGKSSAAATRMSAPAGPAGTTMAVPAGNRSVSFEDPDLTPPESPRKLTAHPEAKRLYEKGFALFARKEYDQSILVFMNFLNRFPGDIYSDNAQFWIGESYLRLNRSEQAEAAYRQVLRNYEHRSTLEGYKTPDAIYRLGQTFMARNDTRRAGYYFRSVMERFPDTSAGRKAYRELAAIGLRTAAN